MNKAPHILVYINCLLCFSHPMGSYKTSEIHMGLEIACTWDFWSAKHNLMVKTNYFFLYPLPLFRLRIIHQITTYFMVNLLLHVDREGNIVCFICSFLLSAAMIFMWQQTDILHLIYYGHLSNSLFILYFYWMRNCG